MTAASMPDAKPADSTTVGLWIEFDSDAPMPPCGDVRVRHARGLIAGLDALAGVDVILLPCPMADVQSMTALFADASHPGRLLSSKLRLIAAGRDPALRRKLIAWAERKCDACNGRLAELGATASPRSWRPALAKAADEPSRRTLAVPRRIAKLTRLTLRLRLAELVLAAARRLPGAHAGLAADLRRRGAWATWIVAAAETTASRRLRGPKILVVGLGKATPGSTGPVLRRLARKAVAVAASSRHAADSLATTLGNRACHVIPPAAPPAWPAAANLQAERQAERRELADELRESFSAGLHAPLHRHFCDFPFERAEYLVAATPSRGTALLLQAFVTVLRRHRRNLTLLIDGALPRGDDAHHPVAMLGLSFDVAEAVGLSEAGRARLLGNARAVVVTDDSPTCVPPVFGEAVALGTPVVMSRGPAIRETLTPEELAAAEYFDGTHGPDGVAQAILHVLDHREAVVAGQRAILSRLSARTWSDVVTEILGLAPRP